MQHWILIIFTFFLSMSVFADCTGFPVASTDDRVLTFLPDLGVFKNFGAQAANPKKKGAVVYNSSTFKFNICDGTNWVELNNDMTGIYPELIYSWGNNADYQMGNTTVTGSQSIPVGLNSIDFGSFTWSQIGGGLLFSCGLRADTKHIWCWGTGSAGRLGNGLTTVFAYPVQLNSTGGWDTTTWKSLSVGAGHSCAIRESDDRLFCWGVNTNGQLGTGNTTSQLSPAALTSTGGWETTAWKSVSAGTAHTCAIRLSDDQLYCWGLNTFGRLGDGTTTQRTAPTALESTGGWSTTTWKSVAAGGMHTCAIRSDDVILCWGDGTNGRLGSGALTQQLTPGLLNSIGGWNNTTWTSLSVGEDHTCAVKISDNTAACWGYGLSGRLGNEATADQSTPVTLTATAGWNTTAWKEVSAYNQHTCGLRLVDELMFCWGLGTNGRLGNGTTSTLGIPTQLRTLTGWNSVAWSGLIKGISNHTCGIRKSNLKLYCWGQGNSSQLASGEASDLFEPTLLINGDVHSNSEWLSVGAGINHSCAIKAVDETIRCWGLGQWGRLGIGSEETKKAPAQLSSNFGWNVTRWSSLSVGNTFNCALLKSDNTARCWGHNGSSQLGTGNTTNSLEPSTLNSTGGWNTTVWKMISAGSAHVCGIRASDDRMFCWGNGANGKLGDEGSANQPTPVPLTSTAGWNTTAWKYVAAGGGHTCAIRASDDRMFCWGENTNGKLGDGTTTTRTLPTALSGTGGWDISTWKSVTIGGTFTCALDFNDYAYCWGSNAGGQFGSGNTTASNTPVPMTATGGWNITPWKKIAAGNIHTCGIRKSDDLAFCWGGGADGKLGNGAISNLSTPTPLSSTGGFNSLKWKDIALSNTHTLGALLSPTSCGYYSSAYNSNDLFVGFSSSGGGTNMGAISRTNRPALGFMAFNRTDKKLVTCNGSNWVPFTQTPGPSCATYPDATSKVVEFMADGSNDKFVSNQTRRPTPREGSLIYNSTLNRLQLCDGTNWQTLGN